MEEDAAKKFDGIRQAIEREQTRANTLQENEARRFDDRAQAMEEQQQRKVGLARQREAVATPTPARPDITTREQLYAEGRRPLRPAERLVSPPQEPSRGLLGRGLGAVEGVARGGLDVLRGAAEDVAGPVSQFMRPPSEIATEAYTAIPRALGQRGPTAAERGFAARADVAVPPGPFESMIGPTALDAIEREFGPNVRREVEFLTSPTGAVTAAVFPVETAAGAISGVALAEIGRKLGASDKAQMALQVYGNVTAGGGAFTARTFRGTTGARMPGLGPEDVTRVTPESAVRGIPAEEVSAPIQRLTTIIRRMRPLRAETEIEKSASLRGKVGQIRRIQERYSGEEMFRRETAALRGPDLPYRAEEGLRTEFSQLEIDGMINHVLKNPAAQARPLEARNAQAALVDMLGGKLPTQGEIVLLERYFGTDLARAVAANRPLGQKAWTTAVDLMNLPRTLMASMDVSFPFRQGIMVAARHPKEWLGNLPNMFRGGFSSRHARLLDEAMSADATIIQTVKGPRALSELASDSGLYRAPIGGFGPMAEREEFFLSNLAKKLPLIGRGVRFSERAFVTYGNKLRQDIFKNTLLSWTKGEKAVTPEDTKALANLLNRMTGRGTLGPANQYAPLLSAGFFAPRFALSRPQAFMQLFNYKNPRIAALAAQEIASFVALGTSALSLLKLSGAADVELDPRSADFGKVKIGNTRIDFWGGNLQWARLVTQLQQQKRKTSTGVIVPASGIDAALRFLRFKGSPPGTAAVDWSLGETAVGQTFPPTGQGLAGEGDITTEIFRRIAPMAIQDLIEAILEHDATGGFLGALAFGGMGVQTYETRAQAFERVTGKSYDETPAMLRRQIIRETPELQRFEAEEPTESEEIRANRSQELLPGAQAVLQDLEDAGMAYTENRRGIMAKFAGAGEWTFRDLDIKPIGRDNKLLSEYHDVDFMADWNKNGVPGDEEDVRLAVEEREGILKQMSPPVQGALQNPANFFPDAEVAEVETMRNNAIAAIQEVVAIPKYQDLNVEEGEAIDNFREEVRQETAQIKRDAEIKGYDPAGITFKMVAVHRLQEDRSLADLAMQAIMAERGAAPLTEERVDKALEHQEVLSIFYPRFLASVLPVAVERHERLSQEAFARINR